MELENIVANTVYLKAREGKSLFNWWLIYGISIRSVRSNVTERGSNTYIRDSNNSINLAFLLGMSTAFEQGPSSHFNGFILILNRKIGRITILLASDSRIPFLTSLSHTRTESRVCMHTSDNNTFFIRAANCCILCHLYSNLIRLLSLCLCLFSFHQ